MGFASGLIFWVFFLTFSVHLWGCFVVVWVFCLLAFGFGLVFPSLVPISQFLLTKLQNADLLLIVLGGMQLCCANTEVSVFQLPDCSL